MKKRKKYTNIHRIDAEMYRTLEDMFKSKDIATIEMYRAIVLNANVKDKLTWKYTFKLINEHNFFTRTEYSWGGKYRKVSKQTFERLRNGK